MQQMFGRTNYKTDDGLKYAKLHGNLQEPSIRKKYDISYGNGDRISEKLKQEV